MIERPDTGLGRREWRISPRALGSSVWIAFIIWLGFLDVEARIRLEAPIVITQVPREVKAPPPHLSFFSGTHQR